MSWIGKQWVSKHDRQYQTYRFILYNKYTATATRDLPKQKCSVKLDMELRFTETYNLEETQSHQSFDTEGNHVIKIPGSILKLFWLFPLPYSARSLQQDSYGFLFGFCLFVCFKVCQFLSVQVFTFNSNTLSSSKMFMRLKLRATPLRHCSTLFY